MTANNFSLSHHFASRSKMRWTKTRRPHDDWIQQKDDLFQMTKNIWINDEPISLLPFPMQLNYCILFSCIDMINSNSFSWPIMTHSIIELLYSSFSNVSHRMSNAKWRKKYKRIKKSNEMKKEISIRNERRQSEENLQMLTRSNHICRKWIRLSCLNAIQTKRTLWLYRCRRCHRHRIHPSFRFITIINSFIYLVCLFYQIKCDH